MAFVVFHDLPGGVYSSGVGLTWMVGIQMLILLLDRGGSGQPGIWDICIAPQQVNLALKEGTQVAWPGYF